MRLTPKQREMLLETFTAGRFRGGKWKVRESLIARGYIDDSGPCLLTLKGLAWCLKSRSAESAGKGWLELEAIRAERKGLVQP